MLKLSEQERKKLLNNAWSEAREKQLILARDFGALCAFIAVICIGGGIFVRDTWLIVCSTIVLLLSVFFVASILGRIDAMMNNRPHHGTQGLTQWKKHKPDTVYFCCACGRMYTFQGVEFHANNLDEGGGRYSLVCEECGCGHYKIAGGGTQPA